MRPSFWFVVPAHGRADLARICLRQLRRTCDAVTAGGIDASAVVIADDENLETAATLGFGTVERQNRPLGRKWNDGYELAGRTGVDYVAPFGTDDWIAPALLLDGVMPADGEIRCCRLSAVVSEDGRRLARLTIPYEGGDGVRIWPTSMLRPLGYRPAQEDRERAIDTSVLTNVKRALGRPPRVVYHDLHALQIVDWKSAEQLNSYDGCLKYLEGDELDPWESLAGFYPAVALAEMAALYPAAVTA